MTIEALTVTLASEAATQRLGAALAGLLRVGDVLALSGGLGAGKTALCRAIIRAATGNPLEDVPSPTFTLVQLYEEAGGKTWWHFDLYRLDDPEDVHELALDEALGQGICLIEWPEKAASYLPVHTLFADLTATGQSTRTVVFTGPPRFLESLRAWS